MPANLGNGLNQKISFSALLGLLMVCSSLSLFCTEPKSKGAISSHQALFEEISLQDQLLFAAFNTCDLKTLESFFAPDIAFYHDLTEPQLSASQVMKSAEDRCERHFYLRRELVKGSMKVHQLYGPHVLQTGTHRFYQKDANGKEFLAGQSHFNHLWEKKDSGWQVIHVISFDHQDPNAQK